MPGMPRPSPARPKVSPPDRTASPYRRTTSTPPGAGGRGVVEHRPESPGRQLFEAGGGLRQPQQALRREQYEGAQLGVARLASYQMEVLRRCGAVRDPQVALGAECQEPLDPRARMLRPLALVPVGEE